MKTSLKDIAETLKLSKFNEEMTALKGTILI